jgi:hypothetical protein
MKARGVVFCADKMRAVWAVLAFLIDAVSYLLCFPQIPLRGKKKRERAVCSAQAKV